MYLEDITVQDMVMVNTKMKSIKCDVDAGYGYNANVAPATLLVPAKQLYTDISRRNE